MLRAVLVLVLLFPAIKVTAQSANATWNAVTEDINDQPENIGGYHIYYGSTDGGPHPEGF